MIMLALAAALFGPQQNGLSAYEGVARDDFAAWSFTSGRTTASGDTRTTSVLARYVTPLPVTGSTATVAYSIHEITFHCAEHNADWASGMNYAADGSALGAGRASTAEAWSASTPGFVQLAQTVCAMNGSL